MLVGWGGGGGLSGKAFQCEWVGVWVGGWVSGWVGGRVCERVRVFACK